MSVVRRIGVSNFWQIPEGEVGQCGFSLLDLPKRSQEINSLNRVNSLRAITDNQEAHVTPLVAESNVLEISSNDNSKIRYCGLGCISYAPVGMRRAYSKDQPWISSRIKWRRCNAGASCFSA